MLHGMFRIGRASKIGVKADSELTELGGVELEFP